MGIANNKLEKKQKKERKKAGRSGYLKNNSHYHKSTNKRTNNTN